MSKSNTGFTVDGQPVDFPRGMMSSDDEWDVNDDPDLDPGEARGSWLVVCGSWFMVHGSHSSSAVLCLFITVWFAPPPYVPNYHFYNPTPPATPLPTQFNHPTPYLPILPSSP